jgi:hypothetical protein
MPLPRSVQGAWSCPEQPLELQTGRRDVLAQFARRYVVASDPKKFKQFARNQMYLTEVS